MDSITQGLLETGHDVRILSIATSKHPDRRESLPANYLDATNFETVFVDTRVRVLPAALSLLAGDSYNISRFNSDGFRRNLIATLRGRDFDIVQLETLPMMNYLADIRAHSKAKIVYRAHNVEHQIWRRLASGASGMKKIYLQTLTRRLEAYERAQLNLADGIAAITREDAAQLVAMGCTKPIIHIPFALAIDPATPPAPGNTFFHIGSMDWEPNIEAMKYLIGAIWPLIRAARPDAVLRLAGRKMPSYFRSENGVKIEGEVPDSDAFMRENGILLAPLRSGGGMRIKIVEAMALGRPVVSTPLGFEGIPVTNGCDAAIGENPNDLAQAAIRYYDAAELRMRTGQAARKMVMKTFERSTVARKLIAFYGDLLR